MAISEITEEEPEDGFLINKQAQKETIRRMLHHQKSLLLSSTTSSSSSLTSSNPTEASRSSSSSSSSSQESKNSTSLLGLMRTGSTSLGRLFGMEHTTLAAHFHDYSCSSTTKTIPLWGSDAEDSKAEEDPWESIRGFGMQGSDSSSCKDDQLRVKAASTRRRRRSRRGKLSRKKSFRKLPRFPFWRWRLRFKRFRILICGKIF
ncbi:unnamed protein product [Linum tenue]|uniref:Uncharacterized protein n=1 Tax=Linum tenue TaxID=586396 RepID=A0AAV0KZP9_9ROSI|nr:unnamed protein product [Linum tenue]